MSRGDRRFGRFLEAIELQRGNPVTAADEAEWEKKLHLLPNIGEWTERLYTFLDRCTSGSAALMLTQCGVGRACNAWRQLADSGCSLREDNVLLMLSKIMNPRSAVPNKDLQGCNTEWECDIKFYA